MKNVVIVIVLVVVGAGLVWLAINAGDGGGVPSEFTKTKSGLMYADVKIGEGKMAKPGDTVFVYYTGSLKNGKVFDSNVNGKPLVFTIGKSQIIAGWHEGIAGMKEGGKRRLIIPPQLGYGDEGYPPDIPPGADLLFEIELAKVK